MRQAVFVLQCRVDDGDSGPDSNGTRETLWKYTHRRLLIPRRLPTCTESSGMIGRNTRVVTIVTILLLSVLTPWVASVGDVGRDGTESQLTVDDSTIETSPDIVKADFGAGTYHFTQIDIVLNNASGTGEILIRLAIPELDTLLLTKRVPFRAGQKSDRTITYQPIIEFYPGVIRKSKYVGVITVRKANGSDWTKIASKRVKIDVVGR